MSEASAPRIFLIAPPQIGLLDGFVTGLASVGYFLRAQVPDADVHVIDLSGFSAAAAGVRIRELCTPTGPFIVGITTTTATYQSALAVARQFRTHAPKSLIVLGGHHASAQPETVLSHQQGLIDAIVVGEGERSFAELVQSYPQIDDVLGLAFLRAGSYRQNPAPALLTEDELDGLPPLLRDETAYATPGKFGHITYVSARGCPLACAFCSVANQRIRAKSVARVAEDIRELVAAGFSRIAIEDNFFAQSPARTREVCAALAALRTEGLNFAWDCQTRVESVTDKDLLSRLAEAGCEAIYLGVESFIGDRLLYLNKTMRPDRYLHTAVHRVIPEILDSEIDCYINLQLGIPGETPEDHHRTIEVARWLGMFAARRGKSLTIFPQLFVVYPGTAHFRQGVASGAWRDDVFESFTQWEETRSPVLSWLGEHFAHGTGGLPVGILQPDGLPSNAFEIDPDKVMRVTATLNILSRTNGIEIFKYGRHLVGAA